MIGRVLREVVRFVYDVGERFFVSLVVGVFVWAAVWLVLFPFGLVFWYPGCVALVFLYYCFNPI